MRNIPGCSLPVGDTVSRSVRSFLPGKPSRWVKLGPIYPNPANVKKMDLHAAATAKTVKHLSQLRISYPIFLENKGFLLAAVDVASRLIPMVDCLDGVAGEVPKCVGVSLSPRP